MSLTPKFILSHSAKFVRLNDWWQYKLAYLFCPLYVYLLIHDLSLHDSITLFTLLLLYLTATASAGHIINDLGDRESDLAAGKYNFASQISAAVGYAAIFILLLLSIFALYLMEASIIVYILASIEIMLFIIYALPPLRLKESRMGIIADAFYAHVIPFGVAILLLFPINSEAYLLIIMLALIWQLFAGIRGILGHEISDIENDMISDTKTAAVTMGISKTSHISTHVASPIELLLFILILFLLGILTFVPIVIFLMYSFIFAVKQWFQNRSRISLNIYLWAQYLDTYYREWLALSILFPAVYYQPDLWPLILTHVLLFNFPRLLAYKLLRFK